MGVCKNITDARILMLHRYETDFGIFDHDHCSEINTMPLLRLHDCENSILHSLRRETMDKFAEKGIATKFGLSWTEFIKLPNWEIEMMFEAASKAEDEEAKIAAKIKASMANGGS